MGAFTYHVSTGVGGWGSETASHSDHGRGGSWSISREHKEKKWINIRKLKMIKLNSNSEEFHSVCCILQYLGIHKMQFRCILQMAKIFGCLSHLIQWRLFWGVVGFSFRMHGAHVLFGTFYSFCWCLDLNIFHHEQDPLFSSIFSLQGRLQRRERLHWSMICCWCI